MTASRKSGATKKRRRVAAPAAVGVASSTPRDDAKTTVETAADEHKHDGTNDTETRAAAEDDDDDDDRRKGRKKVKTQTARRSATEANAQPVAEADAISKRRERKEEVVSTKDGRRPPPPPPPPGAAAQKRTKTRRKKSTGLDATPTAGAAAATTAPPPVAAPQTVPPWELHSRWEKEAAAAAARAAVTSDRARRRSQSARDAPGDGVARQQRTSGGDQEATDRAAGNADPEAEVKEARKKYSAAHGSAAAIERYKTARETRRRESQSDGAQATVRILTESAETRSQTHARKRGGGGGGGGSGANRSAQPTTTARNGDRKSEGTVSATARKRVVDTAVRVLRRVGGDHCPECATPRPLRHHMAAGMLMCPAATCGFTVPHHASLSALPVYVDESDQAHGLVEHVRKFRVRVVQHLPGAQRVADLHMHAIRHELQHRNACTGAHLVKPIAIEQIICELGLPAPLLARATYLAALFSGQPFATFSDAECDALTQMYLEFRTAFARLRSKGANGDESAHGGGGGGGAATTTVTETSSAGNKFPLFNYYMYQFCIARRWYVRARTFPLFKERDALEEADRSYAPIARLLRWDFVRSV